MIQKLDAPDEFSRLIGKDEVNFYLGDAIGWWVWVKKVGSDDVFNTPVHYSGIPLTHSSLYFSSYLHCWGAGYVINSNL